MSRMNWTRYSSLIAIIGALVLTAGIAAGVSVTDHDTPDEAQVGDRITVAYTIGDLYNEYDEWTLRGETNLTNVTWTVTLLDAGNNVVEESTQDGPQFNQTISLSNNVAEVQVRVTGTVPAISNYTYDPPETFRVAEFTQARDGGTSSPIATFADTHHYTPNSQAARTAIENAETAIENAGGHAQAEQTLQNAISAYEANTFDNAISLANQAEELATRSQQSQERNRLLMMAGGVIILIALIGGGIFWYRSRQTGRKL